MFRYHEGELRCDALPLSTLATRYGTPLYVYSAETLRERYHVFERAFRGTRHTICYSVKANSNLSLLKLLAKLGAGFDIVSGGELARVEKAARARLRQTVFSGVGKTQEEMDAALRRNILMFNVESEGELDLLAARAAALKKRALIALRVNPDVRAETHPYISTGLREHKFGVPIAEARRLYRQAGKHRDLEVAGLSVHIGSQIIDVAPFGATMKRLAELVRELRGDGHRIRYVDAGGGLGVNYQHGQVGEENASFEARATEYASAITSPLKKLDVHLLLEPGRALVAPGGLLLTRVLYRKHTGEREFVVADAAMNDLLRPALYHAHHEIIPIRETQRPRRRPFDIVGPVCESGDSFARDRFLAEPAPGDLLAILDAGAYGMSLASNYNTRPRPAEVLVDGRRATVIRRRESLDDLMRGER
jgi:diaminopimelate decarboxylase